VRAHVAAALLITAIEASGCALHQRHSHTNDYGIPRCPDDADRDLLSAKALQCWFTAPHGRWRTLNHQSHLEALVVEVEARDLRDADEIARRLVSQVEVAYSEVLVYVQAESAGDLLRLRRVRWMRNAGFETLDFASPRNSSAQAR
jgi:hypothetical protein